MATEGTSSSQIGSISVGVNADLTPLEAGLSAAEAATRASAARMGATMAGAGGAVFRGSGGPGGGFIGGRFKEQDLIGEFDKQGEKAGKSWWDGFRRSSRDSRALLGGFGLVGVALAATRLVEVGKKIGEAFFEADRNAREFARTLDSIKAPHIEATVAAIIKMRLELGRIGTIDAARLSTLAAIRAEEAKLNAEFAKRVEFLDTLGGLWEGMTRQMNRGQLTAEADKKRLQDIDAITMKLQTQLRAEEAIVEAKEQQERIDRRMREQSKRDITHSTFDATRLGPALDLHQRQRTTN